MNLQYISDQNGIPKSVIIPIEDWNRIKEKYSGLEKELQDDPYVLSNEQEEAIDQALESVKKNGGIPHKQVMAETRKRYPKLFKKK